MFDGLFKQQQRIGEIGEEAVLAYLSKRHKVEDVRLNKYYQNIDIDFIVDGHTLEVKTDNNIAYTGNIYIETYGGGWYEKSQAAYMGIYSPQSKKLYILDYPKLKSLLPSGREIKHYDKDTGLMVPAVLIPVAAALSSGVLTQTIQL